MLLMFARLATLVLGLALLPNQLWASDSEHKTKVAYKILFEDLEKIIKEKNENIEASKLNMMAQSRRTGRTLRSFLPQLTASAGKEQFKKDSLTETKSDDFWKIEANVNLLSGGQDYIEGEIRDQTHELSKLEYQIEIKNELKKARQTYWKIVAINQLLADTEQALQKNEQNYKSTKKRLGAGLTTAADSVQFELFKISLTREKTKLELEKDVALNELSVLLSLDDHNNIEISSQFPKIQNQINDNSANTKFLNSQKQKNLEQIEKLKSDQSANWWWPKLDAYVSYKLPSPSENLTDATNNDKEWTTGLKVTLDLGKGSEDLAESKARALEAKALKYKVARTVRESLAHEHELRHDMMILSELITNSDQDVLLAQKFLQLTEDEYNRGVKNGPDLLEATQTYFEFRRKRSEHYRDYLTAQAELESLQE